MEAEAIFSALADSTRLRVMRLLARMDLAVGELAQVLGQSQPRVSRHVAILCGAGLAERRREGSWTFIRQKVVAGSSDPLTDASARLLDAAEDADPELAARCAQDRSRLAAIREARERSAADYFEQHAEQWDGLRALLTPEKRVEAAVLDALGNAPLGCALDIGTGTGRSAEALADRAEHIVGFDRSPAMLRLARARLQHLPVGSWELVQGDFVALPFAPCTFDTVLLHQVLHFAAEPALPLAEAARVCRPGGRIVIVDLDAHDLEEMRERHAHARLGFSDTQMHGWLTQAGFMPEPPRMLRGPRTAKGRALDTKIWLATRDAGSADKNKNAQQSAQENRTPGKDRAAA